MNRMEPPIYRRNSSLNARDLSGPRAASSTVLDKNWYDTYLSYMKGLTTLDLNAVYFDLLDDLWKDLPDDVILHLLALLEENVWMFSREDMLEQTAGILINASSSPDKTLAIRKRFLFTTTTLFLVNFDVVLKSPSLKDLFDNFIEMLLKTGLSLNTNFELSAAANECLRIIEETSPKILAPFYESRRINSGASLLLATLNRNGVILCKADQTELLSTLTRLPSLSLQETLLRILDAIRSSTGNQTFSPMTFKQFFSTFTMTSEIYHVHFLLVLMKFFGLELFSTHEEQLLINQVIVSSTHPSLVIAQRLLALDFLRSLVPRLRLAECLDPKNFEILPLDGPDTQEKKLTILVETNLEDMELLNRIKPLQTLGLSLGNHRATNSLYRILHAFVKTRPSMHKYVESILISVILASPQQHIRHSLNLMTKNEGLAPKVCETFLQKLLSMSDSDIFKNEDELREYFVACEWMLSRDANLVENLSDLLNFLHAKCQEYPRLVNSLLSCCAATIRNQNVDDNNKEILKNILTFVSKESKSNLAISSWAQIYSIAISTLGKKEYLKNVFTEDCEVDHGGEELFTYCEKPTQSPVQLERLQEERTPVSYHSRKRTLELKYRISTSVDNPENSQKLFALIITISSNVQETQQQIKIPFLDGDGDLTKVLHVDLKETTPFTLSFNCQFNNVHGSTFFYDDIKTETISFRDLLMPIKLEESFDDLWSQIQNVERSMESIICLRNLPDIASFQKALSWMEIYFVGCDQLAFSVLPNATLLVSLEIVNGFVNMHLIASDYEFLDLFYEEVKDIQLP